MKKRFVVLGALCLAALLNRPGLRGGIKKSPDISVFLLMAEVGRRASPSLWPEFDPEKIPTVLFDGDHTYAFSFSTLPPGFQPVPGREEVGFTKGQHPAVRANTRIQLDGAYAASFIVWPPSSLPNPSHLVATILHEKFHVFQALHHPDWNPNDALLFHYPSDTAESVLARRLEVEAFKRAVTAVEDEEAREWAAAGLLYHRERMSSLPRKLADYESKIQKLEGLAEYVEWKVNGMGLLERLYNLDFAPGAIRNWGYVSGRWLGHLLDRLAPGWKEDLEAEKRASLYEALEIAVQGAEEQRSFTAEERAVLKNRTEADFELKRASLERRRKDFDSRLGWRIEMVAGKTPLRLRFFLADQSEAFNPQEMLHTRWLTLDNQVCDLEVIGRDCLTVSDGRTDVLRVVIPGFDLKPLVYRVDGKRVIRIRGVSIRFTRAHVSTRGRTLRIKLG